MWIHTHWVPFALLCLIKLQYGRVYNTKINSAVYMQMYGITLMPLIHHVLGRAVAYIIKSSFPLKMHLSEFYSSIIVDQLSVK